jgi:hypothetical protein
MTQREGDGTASSHRSFQGTVLPSYPFVNCYDEWKEDRSAIQVLPEVLHACREARTQAFRQALTSKATNIPLGQSAWWLVWRFKLSDDSRPTCACVQTACVLKAARTLVAWCR